MNLHQDGVLPTSICIVQIELEFVFPILTYSSKVSIQLPDITINKSQAQLSHSSKICFFSFSSSSSLNCFSANLCPNFAALKLLW